MCVDEDFRKEECSLGGQIQTSRHQFYSRCIQTSIYKKVEVSTAKMPTGTVRVCSYAVFLYWQETPLNWFEFLFCRLSDHHHSTENL